MNNSEYIKILERFILDEMGNGVAENEIKQMLAKKNWPKEMVDLVYDEVQRNINEKKFDVNEKNEEKDEKTLESENQQLTNLMLENTWYQPTWTVGRTWMTDGDGGLPKSFKETKKIVLPEVKISFAKQKNDVANKTNEIQKEQKKQTVEEIITGNDDITHIKEKIEIKEEIEIKEKTEENNKVAEKKSPRLSWPESKNDNKPVQKKKASSLSYALLVTVLLLLLAVALYYRFGYHKITQDEEVMPTPSPITTPLPTVMPVLDVYNVEENATASSIEDIVPLTEEISQTSSAEAVLTDNYEIEPKNVTAKTTPLGELLR